jgi:hypothetical protein
VSQPHEHLLMFSRPLSHAIDNKCFIYIGLAWLGWLLDQIGNIEKGSIDPNFSKIASKIPVSD